MVIINNGRYPISKCCSSTKYYSLILIRKSFLTQIGTNFELTFGLILLLLLLLLFIIYYLLFIIYYLLFIIYYYYHYLIL
jgi:hypothetical protein